MTVEYKVDLSFSCTADQLSQINEYLNEIKGVYSAGEPFPEKDLTEVEINTIKTFDLINAMPFESVGDDHKVIISPAHQNIHAPVVNLVFIVCSKFPSIRVEGKIYNIIPDDIDAPFRTRNVWVIEYDPDEENLEYRVSEMMQLEYPGQTDVPDPVVGDARAIGVAVLLDKENAAAQEIVEQLNSSNMQERTPNKELATKTEAEDNDEEVDTKSLEEELDGLNETLKDLQSGLGDLFGRLSVD